jgi:hypothetical protein
MRKLLAGVVAVATLAIGAGPAFGADQHPPKFGPHDTQYTAGPDQPNCPGNH